MKIMSCHLIKSDIRYFCYIKKISIIAFQGNGICTNKAKCLSSTMKMAVSSCCDLREAMTVDLRSRSRSGREVPDFAAPLNQP